MHGEKGKKEYKNASGGEASYVSIKWAYD